MEFILVPTVEGTLCIIHILLPIIDMSSASWAPFKSPQLQKKSFMRWFRRTFMTNKVCATPICQNQQRKNYSQCFFRRFIFTNLFSFNMLDTREKGWKRPHRDMFTPTAFCRNMYSTNKKMKRIAFICWYRSIHKTTLSDILVQSLVIIWCKFSCPTPPQGVAPTLTSLAVNTSAVVLFYCGIRYLIGCFV